MRPKILVVDNELDVLRSTELLLDRMGYDCSVLPDASLLVEVTERERPDVVMQDLVMPGVNVARLLQRFHQNAFTSHVPIVLFSASTDLAEKAADLDADGYLPKPFGERDIVQVLGRILGPKAVASTAPPAPAGAEVTLSEDPKDRQREAVRGYFHDYWNTLTALSNYAQFLQKSPNAHEPERQAAEEIGRLLLELEKKADALRAQLLEYVK